MFLAERVTDVDYARINDDESYPPVGTTVVSMGWGNTNANGEESYPSNLMAVDLETISNDDCDDAKIGGDSYQGWIYDSMICTWTRGKDACQGDSG